MHLCRKVKWNRWPKSPIEPATPFNRLNPDPIGDLGTSGGKLSVWSVEDGGLDRVVAALVSNTDRVDECAYVLFPSDALRDLNITVENTPGGSKDLSANETLHYDLTLPSAEHLLHLARLMMSSGTLGRKTVPEVKRLLLEGSNAGRLALSEGLLAKVRK